MRSLIWIVYISGLIVAGLLGGRKAMFISLVIGFVVIMFFRRPLTLALARLASRLGLMRRTIERMLAAVESASPIGAHVNLHTLYPDGRVATFTNSELPAPKVLRPNAQRTYVPRCSPDALVVRARSERPNKPFRSLTVEEAPRVYEQLYADEIRFRKAMGT